MTEAQENVVQEEIVQNNAEQAAPAQQDEIEVTDAQQEAPVQAEQQKKSFDPKTDKVEFSTPEQQEKFNYMYKQVKMSDARNQMLNDLLQTQQKRLDEVEGRFKQTDSAEAERILLNKIKTARDSGDDYAEITATKEMVEFMADKKLTEKVTTYTKQQNTQPQLDPASVKYTERFMQETGVDGQLLRPYLNESHPEFNNAIGLLNDISKKYAGDPYALPNSLAELDQTMRAKMTKQPPQQTPQARTPNPMQGGNLTNNQQSPKLKMTRQELDIAKKLGVDPKKYALRRDSEAAKRKS